MNEHEVLLADRIGVIRATIAKYGAENFYISYSGGKDSVVLSHLIDLALPGNAIPRVYVDTGIEYVLMRKFVAEQAQKDPRIVMIRPNQPIKATLETYGYPFKSKQHSAYMKYYQRNGMIEGIRNYLGIGDKKVFKTCPKKLEYMFSQDFPIKVSDECCRRMKELPLTNWAKENHKPYAIIGIMREEGGRRERSGCLAFRKGKFTAFQPLIPVSKAFEDWLIERDGIELCPLYGEPYNFERTGCKGCPFALHLQRNLDVLEEFFPAEKAQCEMIWKPVYDEYRRIGYRLKGIK